MSIDWRQTLKKDDLANGWEWGGIKEFVTKKILPVKGWRHQDLSTLENHFHAMISVDPEVRYSFLRQSAKVGKFLLYVDISYECHLLSLDLAGKTIDWRNLLQNQPNKTSILHNIICVIQENNTKVIFWDVFLCRATTTRSSHSLISFKSVRKIPNFLFFIYFKSVCIRNIPLTPQINSYRMSE